MSWVASATLLDRRTATKQTVRQALATAPVSSATAKTPAEMTLIEAMADRPDPSARSSQTAEWPTTPLILPKSAPTIQPVAIAAAVAPPADNNRIDKEEANRAPAATEVADAAQSPHADEEQEATQADEIRPPLEAARTASPPQSPAQPPRQEKSIQRVAEEKPEISQIMCVAGCNTVRNPATNKRTRQTVVYSGEIKPLVRERDSRVQLVAASDMPGDSAESEPPAITCVAGCSNRPRSYLVNIRPLNPDGYVEPQHNGIVVRRGMKRRLY